VYVYVQFDTMTRPIICLHFLIFGISFAIKHEHVSFAALDHTLIIPFFSVCGMGYFGKPNLHTVVFLCFLVCSSVFVHLDSVGLRQES